MCASVCVFHLQHTPTNNLLMCVFLSVCVCVFVCVKHLCVCVFVVYVPVSLLMPLYNTLSS